MLLPQKYNDGRPVETELLNQTREELISRFDALTAQPGFVQGTWVHEGMRYDEELMRLVVDVEDTSDNQLFFSELKLLLRERFQQLEIYIASYPGYSLT